MTCALCSLSHSVFSVCLTVFYVTVCFLHSDFLSSLCHCRSFVCHFVFFSVCLLYVNACLFHSEYFVFSLCLSFMCLSVLLLCPQGLAVFSVLLPSSSPLSCWGRLIACLLCLISYFSLLTHTHTCTRIDLVLYYYCQFIHLIFTCLFLLTIKVAF